MTVLFFLVLFAFLSLLSFPISFCLFVLFLFLVWMGNTKSSPIIEAKSLLSNGDVAGAFAVLKEGAENGDVMSCFDCGFMMIQGIGCYLNWRRGLKLISKGVELEKESEGMSWKSDGSVSELFEPQTMAINGLLSLMNMDLDDHISS